jgi:hypothetical protein
MFKEPGSILKTHRSEFKYILKKLNNNSCVLGLLFVEQLKVGLCSNGIVTTCVTNFLITFIKVLIKNQIHWLIKS